VKIHIHEPESDYDIRKRTARSNLHLTVKYITSQDNILIRGRSECRKGLSESVKVVENCSCQTMIFKASAQKDATEFSKEK
jgi:hypothetical protein